LRTQVNGLAGVIGERNLAHCLELGWCADYLAAEFRKLGLAVARQEYSAFGKRFANLEVQVPGTAFPEQIGAVRPVEIPHAFRGLRRTIKTRRRFLRPMEYRGKQTKHQSAREKPTDVRLLHRHRARLEVSLCADRGELRVLSPEPEIS
jgi:hypothetical protein